MASKHESLKEDEISDTSDNEVCEEEADASDKSDSMIISKITASLYEKFRFFKKW